MGERVSPLNSVYTPLSGTRLFSNDGSVGDHLYALSQALRTNDLSALSSLPSALLEGIIDYHSNHPFFDDLILTRKIASQLARAVDDTDPQAAELLKILARQIPSDVLYQPAHQAITDIKWEATRPQRTRRNAEELARQTDLPALVIPIAKTAIASGVAFANDYAHLTKTPQDTIVFPIRVSVHRRPDEGLPADESPILSPSMLETMRDMAKDHVVVIFDELYTTGRTRRICEETFVKGGVFEPGTQIHFMTNLYASNDPYWPVGNTKHIVK